MSECEPGTPSFEMTWSSTTSSGYCSQEDSDSELEQYFTARTSFVRKPPKDKDEQIDWEKPVLTQAEIEQKIKEYNSQINSNLFMSLVRPGERRVCAWAMGQGKELTASDLNSQKGAVPRIHSREVMAPCPGLPCSQGLHPEPITGSTGIPFWVFPALRGCTQSPFHVRCPVPWLCPAHSLFGSSSSQNKDGSYTGFIKVQLKLIRPVSVPASKKAPSIQNANKAPRSQVVTRRTSFYLPKDTVKHLHIISRTRASEVIEALLKKFMVVDNPRKFALFERAEKDDQVYLRKLSDEEQPLHLRLLAGPNEKVLSFVLKENETGEVNWDAFSMPELHNFLRILQREEEEHVRQILLKYARCRQKMQEALTTRTPG
ncbi:ras association domain-containing protein 1 isoform X1 [Dermochelys coriacea]|uniref:ras association domain-containing protein 1 isoform X1 n=1 Tax=Dermochelys coriacea TaxID=27794 RepID=UPI001CAA2722|nr:ras association domain-containing protein 1 isoform X1 [Dermochelys coriacea]